MIGRRGESGKYYGRWGHAEARHVSKKGDGVAPVIDSCLVCVDEGGHRDRVQVGGGSRRGAVSRIVSESWDGSHGDLAILSGLFENIQKTRKAMSNRAFAAREQHAVQAEAVAVKIAAELKRLEEQSSRALKKSLGQHPVYPWLQQFPGLAGPLTARLLAVIDDPMRFPGQPCSMGHVRPPGASVDSPCQIESYDGGRCPGVMLAPRTTTGTRSLWHYLGLHVVNGKAPRRQKGVQVSWHTKGKTLLLQPDGLADQIIKHRTPKYRDIYDQTRARLERIGTATADGNSAGSPSRAYWTARKVAVKAFVADLLAEWKRVVGPRVGV